MGKKIKEEEACCGCSCDEHDDECCGEDDENCCGGEHDCCSHHEEEQGGCCGSKGKNHCKKFILVLVGILALAGIITVSILRDRIINKQYKSVTVVGQGRVQYNPDIAILNLGVQVDRATTSEEALNQLNSKMSAIVKAVKDSGVADSDIQTQNYSLFPQSEYVENIQTVVGYNANQQVVVKIVAYDKDPDKLSRVIAAASKAGINQVNSLAFDASNMNDLKQEAKVQAINDAKARGAVLANAAGVELKDITGWWENYMSPTPVYMDYSAKGVLGNGETYSPNIPSGMREVIIEMNITYNIE